MEFSERLSELMEKNKVSAYRLSKELGISQTIIGRYKKGIGEPTAKVALAIADYFDVSVDYLLGRTDNPKGVAEVQILGYVDNENIIHEFEDLTGEELKKLLDFADMMRKARDK